MCCCGNCIDPSLRRKGDRLCGFSIAVLYLSRSSPTLKMVRDRIGRECQADWPQPVCRWIAAEPCAHSISPIVYPQLVRVSLDRCRTTLTLSRALFAHSLY